MRSTIARALLAGIALTLASLQPAASQELNKPPRGFKALFNGRNLRNWQGLIELPKRNKMTPDERKVAQEKADQRMREHWSIENGVLVYDGKGDSLQTAKDYGNFEMYVDWKIAAAGDSGIYLRGNPQVQIWDKAANSSLDKDTKQFIGSGGLYNNQKNPSRPSVVADKPAGEWNTFFIRMIGDKVTIQLNGTTVVDNVPLENYWERGAPLPTRGPIELQHHGNRLEFRNIYLRELPDSAAEPTVTLTVERVPLSQVVQMLAANNGAEIVMADPDGKLAGRPVTYLSIKNRPLYRAIEALCSATGISFIRDENGVFVLSPR